MSHKWVTAVVVCICVAGVCRCAGAGQHVYEPFDYPPGELLDGKVARLTKTTSQFGVEFDSLADVVSFCVAPAFMLYTLALAPVCSRCLEQLPAQRADATPPATPLAR